MAAPSLDAVGAKLASVDWAGGAMSVLTWILITAAVIAIITWMFISAKNKKTYVHRITLINRRSNGTKTRMDLLGGVVKGAGGVREYKVKIPRVWKAKILGYMPDFSLATADDRLIFIQEGDGTIWQQCKETLITEKKIIEDGKEVGTFSLLIEPIPTDVKTVTYNNMQNVRELIDKNRLTAFGITIVGFVIMVIAHLISLFIQTKIKCGV